MIKRTTFDANTGVVIEVLDSPQTASKNQLFGRVKGGPRNIITELTFVNSSSSSDSEAVLAASVQELREFSHVALDNHGVVEYACSDDSEIGKACIDEGSRVHRLTKLTCDLTTAAVNKRCTDIFHEHPGTDLFSSFPLTPWSRWAGL